MSRTRPAAYESWPTSSPAPGGQAPEVPPDNPLTTKEGWKTSVARSPQPPGAADHAGAAGSAASAADRRTGAATRLPRRSAAGEHSRHPESHLHRAAADPAEPASDLRPARRDHQRHVGTGKTTALTQLGRAHEIATRKRHPHDGSRLPVIYVTVPPAATPRMLAVEFARFLGLELGSRANLTDITNAVCSVAAHAHADLVLVDEIHNISLATRTGAEASDQLKYFTERLPATFIYAGVEVEAQGLFAGARGRQIAGRFTVLPAVPFAYGTTAQRDAWHALIATLEGTLRLRHHPPGTLAGMARQLYRRTGGMIGSLSQLVRGAAILAIDTGTEQITEDLLDMVPIDYAAERSHAPARAQRRGLAETAPL